MHSVFGEILSSIGEAIPGAQAAIFADREGETIDLWTDSDQDDALLRGAHWGVVHFLTSQRLQDRNFGVPYEIEIRCHKERVIIRSVADDYFVALLLSINEGNLGKARRMLDSIEARLREEM